jgi:hypothetical protein
VSVNFQSIFALEASGGLMVWGKRSDGLRSFAFKVDGQKALSLMLPEGKWSFYAVGWKENEPLSGSTICAQDATEITKKGNNEVSLKLTNDGCKLSPFNTKNEPEARVCKVLDETKNPIECQEASITSYQVTVESFSRLDDGPVKRNQGITSLCQSWAGGKFLRLPFGSAETAKLFGMRVQFFRTNEKCDKQAEIPETFYFHGGISRNEVFLFKKKVVTNLITSGDSLKYEVMFEIPEDPCTANALQKFAGGNGTEDYPYQICNANQLLNVNDQYLETPDASYILLKDIDLTGFVKGADGRNAHGWDKCMSANDTFLPIGFNNDCNSTHDFTGLFEGNNKSIIGLKMTHPGNSSIGFFRRTKNSTIQNLRLVNPQIYSGNELGTVSGLSYNSLFHNIVIERLDLQTAQSFAGGLIGKSSIDKISKILIDGSVKSTSLINSFAYIGGVIGLSLGSEISLSRFHGDASGTQAVGGIVGGINATVIATTISKTYFQGTVETKSSLNSVYQGGILGYLPIGIKVNLSYNYFFGKLAHQCPGKGNCSVYKIAPLADSTNFSLESAAGETNPDNSLKIPRNQILGGSQILSERTPSLGIVKLVDYGLVNIEGDIPRFNFELAPCKEGKYPEFAGGEGTPTNPFLICTANQLLDIVDYTLDDPNASYKLIRDIDLRGVDLSNRDWYACITSEDDTYLPIGYDSSCNHSKTFTGNIDGNFKSIIGLKMARNQNDIGFISKTSFSSIKNLKLINPTISGNNYIGTIAASSENTLFENIVIEKLDLKPKVNSSMIGGIVGQSSKDVISRVVVDGTITGETSNILGGIAGYASGSSVNFSRFEGMITGNYLIGGVIGKVDVNLGPSRVLNNYVHGIVKSTLEDDNIFGATSRSQGGIIGLANVAVEIKKNYFFGKLSHFCYVDPSSSCDVYPIGLNADSTNFYPVSSISNGLTNEDGSTPIQIAGFLDSSTSLTTDNSDKTPFSISDFSLSNVKGDIPRFDFEDNFLNLFSMHPCRKFEAFKTLKTQTPSDLGTHLVCNRSQIQELPTLASSDSVSGTFTLTNYVFLDEPIAPNPALKFNGVFKGDGRDLLGFTLNSLDPSAKWWSDVSGGAFADIPFLEDSAVLPGAPK